MITISDDFVGETPSVRNNGTSLIIGLDKSTCRFLKIKAKDKLQIYYKRLRGPITDDEIRREALKEAGIPLEEESEPQTTV